MRIVYIYTYNTAFAINTEVIRRGMEGGEVKKSRVSFKSMFASSSSFVFFCVLLDQHAHVTNRTNMHTINELLFLSSCASCD